jgi:hypothetical protein
VAPTVVTVIDHFDVDPYKFTFGENFDPTSNPDFAAAEGLALRLTNPAGNQSANVRAKANFGRV